VVFLLETVSHTNCKQPGTHVHVLLNFLTKYNCDVSVLFHLSRKKEKPVTDYKYGLILAEQIFTPSSSRIS